MSNVYAINIFNDNGKRTFQILNKVTGKVHSTWLVWGAAHAAVRDLNRTATYTAPMHSRPKLRLVS